MRVYRIPSRDFLLLCGQYIRSAYAGKLKSQAAAHGGDRFQHFYTSHCIWQWTCRIERWKTALMIINSALKFYRSVIFTIFHFKLTGLTWLTKYITFTRKKDFSSSLCVQTGSGAHPPSCKMGTGSPSAGLKRGRGVKLTTHPIECRDREWAGAIFPLPQAPSWRVAGQI
jgi:hypothetical protein